MAPRIGVVGAGPAGLAAAWALRHQGFEVTVFEAEAQVGGRSRSQVSAGAVHDLGAWTFTAGSAVHRLATEVGLADRMVTIPATVGRPSGSRLQVGRLDRPLSLAGTVFTPAELLRLGQVLATARWTVGRRPDEPAADWCRHRVPAGFSRHVLDPLAGLYFLQTLDTLSRDGLLGTLRYLARVRLMSFDGGMGTLAAALAEAVPVQTRREVKRLVSADAGLDVIGDAFREPVDGVVAAIPLPEAVRLLAPWLPDDTRQAADTWPYAPSLAVRLLLAGRWPQAALQVLAPRGDRGPVCGLTMARAKGPGRVPPNMELVTLYARPDKVPALMDTEDSRLAARFADELQRWMGPVDVRQSWVQRWKRAAAFVDPQAVQRQKAVRSGLAAAARRAPVWAAGDFLMGSGLDGAVQSGLAAADACRRHFSSRPAG